MKLLRLITNATNLITLANPEQRSTTFSIEQSVAPKKAGSRSVLNSRTAFTSRQISNLPSVRGCAEECSTDTEVVLIKTSISGSVENQLVVEKALKDHLYNLNLAYPEAVKSFINRTVGYAVETDVG